MPLWLTLWLQTQSLARFLSRALLTVSYYARLLPADKVLKHYGLARGQSPHRARSSWRGDPRGSLALLARNGPM